MKTKTQAEILREMVRTLIRKLGILERSEAACCDMTLSQCNVIVEVGRASTLSVNQLAEKLGLDKSTVSRSVDKLVADDLLIRKEDQTDRRFNVICLSPAGEKTFTDLESRMNQYFTDLINNIPSHKREQALEGLRALVGALHDSKCC